MAGFQVSINGRFWVSTKDLDFTGVEEHDHEDIILDMMQAFEQPFHGIQFTIPDESFYETQDGLSWGVNTAYVHEWNESGSEIKLQISRRETPTLPTERRPHLEQSYFQQLPLPRGSGGIESSNKLICHVRLKRSGAWWLEGNGNAMLRIRCALYNGTFPQVFADYTATVTPSADNK